MQQIRENPSYSGFAFYKKLLLKWGIKQEDVLTC
jgi:hypothetical protein